ncbi:MAG: oligosaccharide flippase family protein, partial [Pseudomonadota bacterium]
MQAAMLMGGFGAAQAMSFARNALLAHWLSKGDFGIAAILMLSLQLLETLSDLGADRLIVQARDGHRPRIMANAHAVLLLRGCITALLLFVTAGPLAQLFGVPEATWALQACALIPLIKGFSHLDARRAQRRLDNRPFVLIETLPQALALAASLPLLMAQASFAAVVWLALAHALTAVAVSHLVSRRAYRVALDRAPLLRLIAFGWPIWLSAFPLIAVYHADRFIVAHVYGLEALAGFHVAFMVTMVPGLIAAKAGHALMLPMFARALNNQPCAPRSKDKRDASSAQDMRDTSRAQNMRDVMGLLTSVTVLAATGLVLAFVGLGDHVIQLCFGAAYAGLGPLVSVLALMWALRMAQAVPGMALMAAGETKPLLVAGLLRATGLLPAYLIALNAGPLWQVACAGVAGEALSLAYVTARLRWLSRARE